MPHVGIKVFGVDEINEELEAEALIHSLAGWDVTREEATLTCRKRGVLRTIVVRESSPMDDTI